MAAQIILRTDINYDAPYVEAWSPKDLNFGWTSRTSVLCTTFPLSNSPQFPAPARVAALRQTELELGDLKTISYTHYESRAYAIHLLFDPLL
jgi:hypothetical protein